MTSFLRKTASYINYIARHKWFVFVECVKLGIPLRGLTHDLSKFLPDEWAPYREYFYGDAKHSYDGCVAFDDAWLKHIHRNPHHWQYWLLREDDGHVKPLQMPLPFALEMIADWRGAGKAQGFDSIKDWYEKHQDIMSLHQYTREIVEHILREVGELD